MIWKLLFDIAKTLRIIANQTTDERTKVQLNEIVTIIVSTIENAKNGYTKGA